MNRLIWLAAFVLLVASGCGSSEFCDRHADAWEEAESKSQACPGTSTSFQRGALCSVTATRCNAADERRVGEFQSCVRGVPRCTPENQESFSATFATCFDCTTDGDRKACRIPGLSSDCRNALGGE